MFVSAIVAAGGRGLRLGGAEPKQLRTVGGRAILERSVSLFLAHPLVDEVIVALPADLAAAPPHYLQHSQKRLRIVAGGPRRRDSVAHAFRHVDDRADVVVVHDAARPFATAGLVALTIAAASESGAALAAVVSRDTVKRQGPPQGGRHAPPAAATATQSDSDAVAGQPRYVGETLPRETIFLAQTPQAFRRHILGEALALEGDATDEAALAERAGHAVRIVEGEASNIKITTPGDLAVAEAIAAAGDDPLGVPALPARTGRAGTGYDLHRLVEGRPLVVGGVTVSSDKGALGHSDADVVCHAVTDAILGAACLGDIGRHFPDADSRWKDARSLDLLVRAVELAAGEGLQVGNVDVTVILEAPKLRPHIDAMRAAVAAAVGIDVSRVSIKAKTNEGVDAIGRGEAIAAHAVALLRSAT